MTRCILSFIVAAVLAFMANGSAKAEIRSARRIGCDSAATDSVIDLLVGESENDRTVLDLRFPDRFDHYIRLVKLSDADNYITAPFDRWRMHNETQDSFDIIFYSTLTPEDVIEGHRSVYGPDYRGFFCAVAAWRENTLEVLQTIDLPLLLYEGGSGGCGGSRYSCDTIFWLPLTDRNAPLLSMQIGQMCVGNRVSEARQYGFWAVREDSLTFLNSLWSGQYYLTGLVWNMSGKIEIDSTGRVLYDKNLGTLYGDWSTRTSVSYRIQLDIRSGRLVPVALVPTVGESVGIRPRIPKVIYPHHRLDTTGAPHAADTGWSGYSGPNAILRMIWRATDHAPSRTLDDVGVSLATEGDSLRIEAGFTSPAGFAIWLDTAYSDDLRNPDLDGSEFVLMIEAGRGSSDYGTVRRYTVTQDSGEIEYTLVSEHNLPVLSPTRNRDQLIIKLSLADVGLAGPDSLYRPLGIALEYVRDSLPPTQGRSRPAACYPEDFKRLDPRTWGNLTIGHRIDYHLPSIRRAR